jgi:thiamine-phosphate pyrophosphorylase
VYPTPTKPGYGPALGPDRAAALAGGVPWLALGGVHSAQRAAACAAAGASGIAVLGAVMGAGDPESLTRTLARAFVDASEAKRDPGRNAGHGRGMTRDAAGVWA